MSSSNLFSVAWFRAHHLTDPSQVSLMFPTRSAVRAFFSDPLLPPPPLKPGYPSQEDIASVRSTGILAPNLDIYLSELGFYLTHISSSSLPESGDYTAHGFYPLTPAEFARFNRLPLTPDWVSA